MARLLRIAYEAAVGHVTARDNERRAISQEDADREQRMLCAARTWIADEIRPYVSMNSEKSTDTGWTEGHARH
jgi:hypothetical protein